MAVRLPLLRFHVLAAALGLVVSAPAALAASPHHAAAGMGHMAPTAAKAQADIVDTAMRAGQFKTLTAALKAAGLVDTLKGTGPFTVFAPTDAAFAALPPGTVENLLKPENHDTLVKILTYHVVPGRVMAAQVAGMPAATTVEGQPLKIAASSAGVTVNGAHVVKADIAATNGVIHVIDKVLMPQG